MPVIHILLLSCATLLVFLWDPLKKSIDYRFGLRYWLSYYSHQPFCSTAVAEILAAGKALEEIVVLCRGLKFS